MQDGSIHGTADERDRESAEDDDLPDHPFELRALRQFLPEDIQALLGAHRRELLVEMTIADKIARVHPADRVYLLRLGQFLQTWEYAGQSPKLSERLEIYGQIDEIWFTAVIRVDTTTGCSLLVTMHRIYPRKVQSRIKRGYLVKRED